MNCSIPWRPLTTHICFGRLDAYMTLASQGKRVAGFATQEHHVIWPE